MSHWMRYQSVFGQELKAGRYRLHLEQGQAPEGLLAALAALNEAGRAAGERRTSRPLEVAEQRVFVKRFASGDLKHKWRITFGLKRRKAGLDWPLAELRNSCEALVRGAEMPRLKGFGYCLSRFGLVEEVFLVFEMLDGYVDGREWLKTLAHSPQQLETFLGDCIALQVRLHRKQIFHLDPWLENVMLHPERPRELIAIDFENCFIGEPGDIFTVLGFQYGYMFQRGPLKVFPEARFDAMVEAQLKEYPGYGSASLDAYHACKRQWLGRKERQLTPHGVIRADKVHPFPASLVSPSVAPGR